MVKSRQCVSTSSTSLFAHSQLYLTSVKEPVVFARRLVTLLQGLCLLCYIYVPYSVRTTVTANSPLSVRLVWVSLSPVRVCACVCL